MTRQDLAALRAQISLVRLTDRPKLDREWQRLRAEHAARREIERAYQKLSQKIETLNFELDRTLDAQCNKISRRSSHT